MAKMTERSPEESWPDLAGRMEGKTHVLAVRVYYEDTDFSGLVYHANYLKFCERGRSDCLRLLGVHHHELRRQSAGGLGFVVRRMICDFLKPAGIDDVVTVETSFVALTGARMEIAQAVTRHGETLFKASVTAALVDAQGRPRRFPSAVVEALSRMAPG
jgi:acyl-CoA thioester hydrolase